MFYNLRASVNIEMPFFQILYLKILTIHDSFEMILKAVKFFIGRNKLVNLNILPGFQNIYPFLNANTIIQNILICSFSFDFLNRAMFGFQ